MGLIGTLCRYHHHIQDEYCLGILIKELLKIGS